MAFEYLYKFVDELAESYKYAYDRERVESAYAYLSTLTKFYETVLKTPKFKDQREYCKKKIQELNPAYYAGYFGKVKKSQTAK